MYDLRELASSDLGNNNHTAEGVQHAYNFRRNYNNNTLSAKFVVYVASPPQCEQCVMRNHWTDIIARPMERVCYRC